MPTESFEYVYLLVPVGASGNYKINDAGAFTSSGVTFSDADNTMVAGDQFTYGGSTFTFSGTGGPTGGFFATRGTSTYYFSHTQIAGGTNIGSVNTSGTELITCFTAGTWIDTERGHVPVEHLKAGDMVRTASGEFRPVKWVGIQRISMHFAVRERAMPVRIRAGALGDNLPTRDLTVSPGHAIFIDGVLCNAAALVNGTTIVRHDPGADFDYYHVELDNHDLLISEGVASESYLCTLDRNKFSNAAEYRAAFGDAERPVMPMPLPRATVPAQLPQSVRERILGKRAA
jgi:hypothetical protein